MLDEEYNKPPKDVVIKLKKAIKKNKHHFVSLSNIAGVVVFEIHRNIFCIHELIVDKEFRNEGAGIRLMKKIHKKFKGIFIVKTTSANKFYQKLGYKAVEDNLLVFINDKKVLSRNYWIK